MIPLLSDCPMCLPARDAVVSLKNAMNTAWMDVRASLLGTGSNGKKERIVPHTLEVNCRRCGNKLLVLSPEGEQVMDAIKIALAPPDGEKQAPF